MYMVKLQMEVMNILRTKVEERKQCFNHDVTD